MSIPRIYKDLINGLLQKSMSKEVNWDVTTNANVFVVYFKESSLILNQHNNQNEAWISVDLIDYKGDIIDGFWVSGDESEDWNVVSELFSLARRSALAIDNTIQGMLKEINKDGIVGEKKRKDDEFTDDIPF